MSRRLTLVVAAVCLVILVGLVPVGRADAKARSKCVVPNLRGLTLPNARHKLRRRHCRVGIVIGIRRGIITRQLPRAGRKLRRGTRIRLMLRRDASFGSTNDYSVELDGMTIIGSDPYDVTYSYAADATQQRDGKLVDLAATGALPSGLLSFYSDGVLMCSQVVGGAVNTRSCTVTYPNPAVVHVLVRYVPDTGAPVSWSTSERIGHR